MREPARADTWRIEGRVEGAPREHFECRCSVSVIFHRSLADSFNLEKRGTLPPIRTRTRVMANGFAAGPWGVAA